MPPKRKTKASSAATPAAEVEENAMEIDMPETSAPAKPDPMNELWTDEQETSLFKGIIKWKPSGQSICQSD
jgi:hypothetical protein